MNDEITALLETYINGNLTDAKKRARHFEAWELREELTETFGYSAKKAALTADWLKGRDCFQAACDAE